MHVFRTIIIVFSLLFPVAIAFAMAETADDAKFHQEAGDNLLKEEKLKEALDEYEKARELGGETSGILKDIGKIQKWLRNYRSAEASYERALELNPEDQDAQEDLNNIRIDRGLRIRGWLGGWEPDYTKEGYETALFYGGLDRLDMNLGYSYSDQVYYSRNKIYASGYYFYRPSSYMKLYLAMKDYDYPLDPSIQKPNPDSNSYDKVPIMELEISHWFVRSLRGNLAYERFTPNFFYDKDTTAINQKISAELYYKLPDDFFRAKIIYAYLKDPDPSRTEIKGRDNLKTSAGTATATDIQYQSSSLLGGSIEVQRKRWNAEFKYLPNRDLDNSYKYSFLTGIGYEINPSLSARLDYVYDKYSSTSNFSGHTSNVYLVSLSYEVNPSLDIGIGLKHIDIPRGDDSTGFLSLSYKTGLFI